jgi:TonB family protein
MQADMKEASISIGKKRPSSKGSVGFSRGTSIGYNKSMELKKYSRKTPDMKNVSSEAVKKSKETSYGKVKEAKIDKKSVEIMGPVTKRKIIKSYLPEYPNWARAQQIEADVVIRFFVSPDGKVRQKMILERTSGYSKLDKLAMKAIQEWIFESISAGDGDQWGVVTFKYLLK